MQWAYDKQGADSGFWPLWSNRVRAFEYQGGIITEGNRPQRAGVPLEGPYPTEF